MEYGIRVRKFAPDVYMGYCPQTKMFGCFGSNRNEAHSNVLQSIRRWLWENSKWILERVYKQYNEKYTEGYLRHKDYGVFPRIEILENPKGHYAISFRKLYSDDSWPIKFKTEIAANICVQDYLECFLCIDNHLISDADLFTYYEKIKERIYLLKNQ